VAWVAALGGQGDGVLAIGGGRLLVVVGEREREGGQRGVTVAILLRFCCCNTDKNEKVI